MSPRIVLPGLESKKVRRAFRNLPYAVFVIIILIASSIGVFYFHGLNPRSLRDLSSIYNPDWFERNNRSKKPPDVSKYLRPPETNASLPGMEDILGNLNASYVHFLVRGRVPLLAWRFDSLDTYVMNSGWEKGAETFSDYSPEGRGLFSFEVIKPNVFVEDEGDVQLVSLWSPSYGVEAGSFSVERANVSQVFFVPRISDRNEILSVHVGAEKAVMDISYVVYGSYIDEDAVRVSSAAILDVKNYVSNHPELEYFLRIPEGYFSTYPHVLEEINAIGINDSNTVYQAISLIVSSIVLNYYISLNVTQGSGDPVARFVETKNGSILDYIYTVAFFARAVGIPSRIIIGYLGGEYNDTIEMTMLTIRNLFIWVEVFDPGVGGWVPYNCLAFITGDVLNLVDSAIILHYLYIQAPRYVQGYPCVYLDENFTLIFIIYGPGAGDLTGYVYFYDVNESALLGRAVLTKLDESTAQAVLTLSYEEFYNRTGLEPLYGLHLIKAVYGKFVALGFIGLLRRVTIQPLDLFNAFINFPENVD